MKVMWGMIHVVDCAPQFVLQMHDGVAIRGLYRLVHFSDVLLLQIINHYSGTMIRSIVILVATIISNVLPSKWYHDVPQDVPIHHATDVPIQEHKGWFGTPVECPPDMDKTPFSFDPGSLAVLLGVFSRQSTNSHAAIDRGQLKTWLISPDSTGPSNHSLVLPPPCPVKVGSAMIRSQQGIPPDPASTVACDHKSVVNRLTADMHLIQIPHPLSESMGTFEVVFVDHFEEDTFLGRGLWSFEEFLLTSLVPDWQLQLASGRCD